MSEAGLSNLDLGMAAARGLAAALVLWPLSLCAAEQLAAVPGWPLRGWLTIQLPGATLGLACVACAWWEARRAPRRSLSAADRSLLVALAITLGLCLGAVAGATSLALAGALLGGVLAGSQLWGGNPWSGSGLGGLTSVVGLVGGLPACVVVAGFCWSALGAGLAGGALGAVLISVCLALVLGAWYGTAQVLSSLDPLVSHSWLERSGNSG